MLPGCDCRLQTLEGGDMSKGLEICVNLGLSWNKSLIELSGGQRLVIYFRSVVEPRSNAFCYFSRKVPSGIITYIVVT